MRRRQFRTRRRMAHGFRRRDTDFGKAPRGKLRRVQKLLNAFGKETLPTESRTRTVEAAALVDNSRRITFYILRRDQVAYRRMI